MATIRALEQTRSRGVMRLDCPRVSIVLPTFNRAQLLRPCIASVLAQTLDDWELIVADDGSEQATLGYLETLTTDQRVRILRLAHSGNPGKARNAAIGVVRAPFVAFMDSDDLWQPNMLERHLEELHAQPDCGWSYSAFTIVDGDNLPLESERTRRWVPHHGQIFPQTVRTTASIRMSAVIVKTQLLRDAGAFDESIDCVEDYDLWMRLALLSPVCVVDEPLVRIRRHSENQTRTLGSFHVARDYSLNKLSRGLGVNERALIREERSRNASRLAALLANHGRLRAAVSALTRSLPLGWRYAHWWYHGAKTLLACVVTTLKARPEVHS